MLPCWGGMSLESSTAFALAAYGRRLFPVVLQVEIFPNIFPSLHCFEHKELFFTVQTLEHPTISMLISCFAATTRITALKVHLFQCECFLDLSWPWRLTWWGRMKRQFSPSHWLSMQSFGIQCEHWLRVNRDLNTHKKKKQTQKLY